MSAHAPLGRRIVHALAGAIAVGGLAWGAWVGYDTVATQPIERVVFSGELDRLAQPELDALAQAVRAAPSAPLEAIRASARRVPWVRDAAVRRAFPGTVEITFDAYEALARWNEAFLVSRAGEVFVAPDAGELPRLRGPEGKALEVVAEYVAAAAVFAPLGAPIAEFRLSPRGAWHATLASGLAIALGRGDWRPRAERFVAAWPRLAPEAKGTVYADLRYSGGFALRRAATLTLTPATSPGRGSTP